MIEAMVGRGGRKKNRTDFFHGWTVGRMLRCLFVQYHIRKGKERKREEEREEGKKKKIT